MQNVILVIHILACLVMIGLVLVQKSEGGGLGVGGTSFGEEVGGDAVELFEEVGVVVVIVPCGGVGIAVEVARGESKGAKDVAGSDGRDLR